MAELKTYHLTPEHDQVFVKRFHRNPRYQPDQDRPGHDKRMFVPTAEWTWLSNRHREHWRAEGDPNRAIPANYRDPASGEEGWWFPKVWTVAYAEGRRAGVYSDHVPVRVTPRGERIDSEGGMLTKAERRDLPAGTIVTAKDATLTYPDGHVETWGQFRRRRRGQEREEAA